MDRRQLVNTLKSAGYADAKPTLESVNTYIADNFIELVTETGEKVDVSKAWNTAASVTVAPVEKVAEIRGTKAPHAPIVEETKGYSAPQRFNIGNIERKAYEARNKGAGAHERVFDSADEAELAGAYFRYKALAREDYAAKASDVEILKAYNIVAKDAVSYDFASGGALVPDVLRNSLINIRSAYSALRQLFGGFMPIAAAGESVPRRTGGVTVYSPGEGVAATASEPAFDQVKLTPFEMVALAKPTRTLISRSVLDYGNIVASEMVYAIDKKQEEIFFTGDGSATSFNQLGLLGKYTNLVTGAGGTWATNADYAAGIVVAAGNLWSEITYDNIMAVVARPQYTENPLTLAWACSRTFYYQVMIPLATARGGSTRAEVLNGVSTPMFEGFPVVFSNAMPQRESNSSVCLHFGDFATATKVAEVPGTMTMETSTERFFDERKIAYQIAVQRAINVHDIGNANATAASREPGPFASLITAAS